jgi:PAS domain S-box-containing protein
VRRRDGLNVRLLGGSALLLLIVAAAFAVTLRSVDQVHDANDELARSLAGIASADRVERLAIDAETSQRGFIISAEERFLDPYRETIRELPEAEQELLAALPETGPRHHLATAALDGVQEYVRRYVPDQVALARRDPDAARAVVASGAGKQRMDAIRADFAALQRAEKAHAAELQERSDDATRRVTIVALLGLVLCPLLVAGYAGYLSRLVVAPIRRVAGAAARRSAGDLEARAADGGVGEARTLVAAFNEMADTVQDNLVELEHQNAELEAQQGELERTLDALGDEKDQAEAFHRVVARISAAGELEQLAEVLLGELGDVLGADAGTLYALEVSDPDGPLTLAGVRGLDRADLPPRLSPGAGPAGRAVSERRTIAVEHGESGLRLPALGGAAPIRHELHLPLAGSTRIAGVLSFGRVGDAAPPARAVELAGRLLEPAAVGLVRALTTQYAQHHAEVNQAVLETAQDAYVAADGDSVVLEWSPQAEALFGWSATEATGRRIPDLIVPARDRAFYERWHARLIADAAGGDASTHRFELTACRKDGEEVTVELSIVPLPIGEGWRVNAFVRDITGRVLREREREARGAVSRVLAEVEGREALIEPTLAGLGTTLRWPLVVFWLPDERGLLTCSGCWRDPQAGDLDALVHLVRSGAYEPGSGLVGRVWETGEASWTRAAGEGSVRARAAGEAGLPVAGAIPVGRGAHRLGVMEFWQAEATAPDAELFDTLDAIASLVVQVAERRAAEAEADRLKNEFFALVSHELRTPLTSIVGYVELVREGEAGDLNDQQRRFLGVVERNARRLQRLVGDLLFVAQVEAGTLALDSGRADLAQIVRDAVEGATPRAEQLGVAVAAEVEPLPQVDGDGDRLGQLVDNLVSNALKFTPAGGRVTVALGRDGGEAVLSVADTGIGIPPAEQARLFDRFYRASTAVEEEIPGIGLGLSICQAIAEGHGGRIEVMSEVGAGTTFRVRLPLARRGPGGRSPETDGAAPAGAPTGQERR